MGPRRVSGRYSAEINNKSIVKYDNNAPNITRNIPHINPTFLSAYGNAKHPGPTIQTTNVNMEPGMVPRAVSIASDIRDMIVSVFDFNLVLVAD